jgi:hypothetical protein
VNSPAATVTVFTLNSAPHANAGLDQSVNMGPPEYGEVTLDGSGSSDPDGDALTYSWTWPGGPDVPVEGVNPLVVFPLGTTKVTLVVNDGTEDSESDTVNIEVVVVPDDDCDDDDDKDDKKNKGKKKGKKGRGRDRDDKDKGKKNRGGRRGGRR